MSNQLVSQLIDELLEDWREDALCAQTDPEAFFPDKGENPASAKDICRQCPVQIDCLDFAMRNNEPYGVWGGYTARERQYIRNRFGTKRGRPRNVGR